MSRLPDHYKVLQVDPAADPDVITAAFRILARRLHPDRDITGVHEVRMAELNRAYAVLRDPEKRATYDAERRLEPMGPGIDEEPRRGGLAARWNGGKGIDQSGHEPKETQPGVGGSRLNFGRYAGMTLGEIASKDAEYLRWLARHSSGLRYRHEIQRILREAPADDYSLGSSR
jgi:curved DNA-binding protein CbpA